MSRSSSNNDIPPPSPNGKLDDGVVMYRVHLPDAHTFSSNDLKVADDELVREVTSVDQTGRVLICDIVEDRGFIDQQYIERLDNAWDLYDLNTVFGPLRTPRAKSGAIKQIGVALNKRGISVVPAENGTACARERALVHQLTVSNASNQKGARPVILYRVLEDYGSDGSGVNDVQEDELLKFSHVDEENQSNVYFRVDGTSVAFDDDDFEKIYAPWGLYEPTLASSSKRRVLQDKETMHVQHWLQEVEGQNLDDIVSALGLFLVESEAENSRRRLKLLMPYFRRYRTEWQSDDWRTEYDRLVKLDKDTLLNMCTLGQPFQFVPTGHIQIEDGNFASVMARRIMANSAFRRANDIQEDQTDVITDLEYMASTMVRGPESDDEAEKDRVRKEMSKILRAGAMSRTQS